MSQAGVRRPEQSKVAVQFNEGRAVIDHSGATRENAVPWVRQKVEPLGMTIPPGPGNAETYVARMTNEVAHQAELRRLACASCRNRMRFIISVASRLARAELEAKSCEAKSRRNRGHCAM
jgi:hypothetical protein